MRFYFEKCVFLYCHHSNTIDIMSVKSFLVITAFKNDIIEKKINSIWTQGLFFQFQVIPNIIVDSDVFDHDNK